MEDTWTGFAANDIPLLVADPAVTIIGTHLKIETMKANDKVKGLSNMAGKETGRRRAAYF